LKKALIALYCSYAARYMTSFLSIPFLARVLGRKGLGDLAMMTSMAAAVAVWVEYGVGISALREISSADPEDRNSDRCHGGKSRIIRFGASEQSHGGRSVAKAVREQRRQRLRFY
jgi:O-antigen/teichoic acid export membrane protein